MFKIFILQAIVAAAIAGPMYPGGMGYGGMGTSTSTVSVRRTSVVSPGMYGGGMMPGMGMGTVVSGVYGTGTMGMLVDGKTAEGAEETVVEEKKETVASGAPLSETAVEAPVGEAVEVVKTIENQSPMGQLRAPVVGVGSAVTEQRTDVMRAGLGGMEKTSVGETRVSTPFGSQASVSSVQQRTTGLV